MKKIATVFLAFILLAAIASADAPIAVKRSVKALKTTPYVFPTAGGS